MLEHDELASLADSWLLRLRAERKSDRTLKVYRDGVRQYLAWCASNERLPALDPDTLAAFVNGRLADGAAPATARIRQLAVRRFSAWLAAEDEIDRDLLLGVRPPKLDERPVDGLDDDEAAALVKACAGKRLEDVRDAAVVRLMLETGLRAGEVVGMDTADVDLSRGLATVRGKGGKPRAVAFGPATGAAIDKYLRMRRRHVRAGTPTLWLGGKGGGFGYAALYASVVARGRAAGIPNLHPHRLRHAFASRWLDAGGSEQGLMSMAGWSRREMLDRYSKDTSARRSHDEARRLNLGDL